MKVFDMLKSDKLRPYYHLALRLDKTDCTGQNKKGLFFPTTEEIAEEILGLEDEVETIDAAVSIFYWV